MSFTFECTKCGKVYHGNEKIAGKRMKCPKCGTVLRIPVPRGMQAKESPSPRGGVSTAAPKRSEPRSANSKGPPAHAPAERVTCPHCKSSCRIQPEWRGRSIQCPSCQKPFTAPLADARPKVLGQVQDPVPEFIPDDATQAPEFVVAEDDGAPLYEVVEEPPAAPELPPPRSTPKRRKQTKPGGAFGEWVRGQGLWILDGVALAVFVVFAFLRMPSAAPGASGAVKVGAVVCLLVVFLPLILAIGAVILRLACRLCQVETPGFLPCMGIVMLIGMVNALINQLVGLVVNVGDPQVPNLGAVFGLLAISLAVGAAASIPVLIVTLEISAGRAALVWLIEVVFMIVVVIVLVLVIVGIALALGFSQALRGTGPAGQPQMMPAPGQQFPGNPLGPGQQFPGMPQGPGQQVPGTPSGPGQGSPGMPQGPGQPLPRAAPAPGQQVPGGSPAR